MQKWWDDVVMSGVRPIAKIRQPDPPKKKTAEPSLFDFIPE